jgi:hypothetical protein
MQEWQKRCESREWDSTSWDVSTEEREGGGSEFGSGHQGGGALMRKGSALPLPARDLYDFIDFCDSYGMSEDKPSEKKKPKKGRGEEEDEKRWGVGVGGELDEKEEKEETGQVSYVTNWR